MRADVEATLNAILEVGRPMPDLAVLHMKVPLRKMVSAAKSVQHAIGTLIDFQDHLQARRLRAETNALQNLLIAIANGEVEAMLRSLRKTPDLPS